MVLSLSFLLIMRNVTDESCRENINTHIVCSVIFFPRKLCLYEIMWKNIVEPDRPQMTVWRFAWWILKSTNKHTEYVIVIAYHGNIIYTNAPVRYVIVHFLSCCKINSEVKDPRTYNPLEREKLLLCVSEKKYYLTWGTGTQNSRTWCGQSILYKCDSLCVSHK